MNDPIVEKISRFAEELLPSKGLELVEVQFRREQHGWVLRIFIDAQDGVSLDHCTLVSREVSDYLDVEDCIGHPFHLEISSPGLERKLNRYEDFVRFCGKKAKIKLHHPINEQKVFVGLLENVREDGFALSLEGGEVLECTFDMLSSARLAL